MKLSGYEVDMRLLFIFTVSAIGLGGFCLAGCAHKRVDDRIEMWENPNPDRIMTIEEMEKALDERKGG